MPPDVVAEEGDFLKRLLSEDDHLNTLWRISENGMKQYRRTRTEATRTGVKLVIDELILFYFVTALFFAQAKKVIKENVIRSIHPLIIGMDPEKCSALVFEKAQYIRHLQSFRPAQTVFETGIGTGM